MDGSLDGGPPLYLETVANPLRSLKRVLTVSSKRALKSLNNQTDFDSAIRRFDPSRPSQPTDFVMKTALSRQNFQRIGNPFASHLEILCWFRFWSKGR